MRAGRPRSLRALLTVAGATLTGRPDPQAEQIRERREATRATEWAARSPVTACAPGSPRWTSGRCNLVLLDFVPTRRSPVCEPTRCSPARETRDAILSVLSAPKAPRPAGVRGDYRPKIRSTSSSRILGRSPVIFARTAVRSFASAVLASVPFLLGALRRPDPAFFRHRSRSRSKCRTSLWGCWDAGPRSARLSAHGGPAAARAEHTRSRHRRAVRLENRGDGAALSRTWPAHSGLKASEA
jgi:hypothetical protein